MKRLTKKTRAFLEDAATNQREAREVLTIIDTQSTEIRELKKRPHILESERIPLFDALTIYLHQDKENPRGVRMHRSVRQALESIRQRLR